MTLFWLGVGIVFYYVVLYVITKTFLRILSIKRQYLWRSVLLIIESIPVFCIIDYMHRGNPFIGLMSVLGYIIAAFLLYFLIAFALLAIILPLLSVCLNKKYATKVFSKFSLWFCSGISIAVLILGSVFAVFPTVTQTTVFAPIDRDFKIIVLSDIHYGSTGSVVSLKRMVEQVNCLQPDLIILAGDVLDQHVELLSKETFTSAMNTLDATYGVVAVTGNHEFATNTLEQIIDFYDQTSVRLLLDEQLVIADRIRLVGRIDDHDPENRRKPLKDYVEDSILPLLVVDHQPQYFKEAKEIGAFLQLSGHTHNGQIFPGNWILSIYNRLLYDSPSNGMHTYDDFTLAISRGYGTWGFPFRLTGASEILEIILKA